MVSAWRHRAAPVFAGAVLALVLAVGVSVALAAGLTKSPSSVGVGPIPAVGTTTATCPSGEKIVSGGFDSPGFDPHFGPGPSVLPYASFKASKSSWTVSGKNQSLTGGSITGYAFCAPSVGKVNTRSATVTIPSNFAIGTAKARCPSGQKIVAGGVNSPGFATPGPRVFPFSSYKSGSSSWVASAVNTNTSTQAGTLQVFAYCAKYAGVFKKSKSTTIAGNLGVGGATAKCPSGKLMLSGGFKSPTFVLTGSALLPTSSRKKGANGWRVSAFNDGTSTKAGSLRVFAYCLK